MTTNLKTAIANLVKRIPWRKVVQLVASIVVLAAGGATYHDWATRENIALITEILQEATSTPTPIPGPLTWISENRAGASPGIILVSPGFVDPTKEGAVSLRSITVGDVAYGLQDIRLDAIGDQWTAGPDGVAWAAKGRASLDLRGKAGGIAEISYRRGGCANVLVMATGADGMTQYYQLDQTGEGDASVVLGKEVMP